MIRFITMLVILIVALVVMVVYAGQNSQTITVSLFENHWKGVAAWVPVAVAAAGVAALFLLYLLIAGTTNRVTHATLRRRVNDLEGRANRRNEESERLRDRNTAAEARTEDTGATAVRDHGERPVSPADPQPK